MKLKRMYTTTFRNRMGKSLLLLLFVVVMTLQVKAQSGGDGTVGYPYQIASLDDLKWIAGQVNGGTNTFSGKYLKQTANIDASETSSGTGWIAIGAGATYAFSGSYDGQGYTISNLHINNSSNYYDGLFAYCLGATIKNLGLTNISINSGDYVGGLVGYIDQNGTIKSSISNCYVTGSVTSKNDVGGLIGEADNTTIDNCYAECTITCTGNSPFVSDPAGSAGGFMSNSINCTISNSYASGSVTVSNSASVGGFTGGSSGTTINNCYSSCSISTNGVAYNGSKYFSNIGGFLGDSKNSDISNCYANGSISANGVTNVSCIGGFVGTNGISISYCYATSSIAITGTSDPIKIGGFVGVNFIDETIPIYGVINANCYWNSTIFSGSGCGTNPIGATFSATGKTTVQMKTKTTFTNALWDFLGESANGTNDYWNFISGRNNDYPILIFLPRLTTTNITTFGSTSATMGGNITNDGNGATPGRGIVYSLSTNTDPVIGGTGVTQVSNAAITNNFSAPITGLSPNTMYYVQAYTTNSKGTSYGGARSFTTSTYLHLTGSEFSVGDNVAAFNKTYSGTSFTFTPASSNYTDYYTNGSFSGLYSYDKSTSYGTQITITAPGYSFDLNNFSCYADGAYPVDVTVTYIDGSTATNNYTTTSSVVNVLSPTRNDVVSVKLVTNGYVTFNDFDISNINALPIKPTITSATYDAGTGALVLICTNLTTGDTVDPSKITLTGEGGATYVLTTSSVTANSSTSATITLNGTDKAAVNLIINKNGLSSTSGTTYNLAAADDWDANVISGNTADATNGITVSNLASPTVTTQAVTSIWVTTATGNGNITNLGVPNPTAYGVCWNTGGTPTTSDSKVDKGSASSTGAFTASMTSLSANTTYHVRAFATNAAGTSYGDEVSFTTLTSSTLTVLDNTQNETASITTILGSITTFNYQAKVFTVGSEPLQFESLKLSLYNTTTAGVVTITCDLYSVDGSNNPTGLSLGTSSLQPTLTTTAAYYDFSTNLGGVLLQANTTYILVFRGNTGSTGGTISWTDAGSNNSYITQGISFVETRRSLNSGSSWFANSYNNGLQIKMAGSFTPPALTTTAVTIFDATSATIGGNVSSDGGFTVTEKGVVYSLASANINPQIGGTGVTKAAIGTGTGIFSQSVGSLTPGTLYYINAYAINAVGTSYGTATSFTTLILPTVTTQAVSDINVTSATGNGNIISLGVPNPTQYGVVWDASANPTIGLSTKTTQGTASSLGAFTSSITGLTANTLYHVRAYATNSAGTSYGDDVTFTTSSAASTISGSGNWSTIAQWDHGTPGASSDVTIGTGTVTVDGNYTVNNATVSSGGALNIGTGKSLTVNGNLTLKSDATNTTSLIINGGALNVTGTITVERYMVANKWYIISPTASGQTVANFLSANTNIPVNSSSQRAMQEYVTGTNSWSSYFTSGTAGTMDAGKGYAARISTTGVVDFVGTLTSGPKDVTVTRTGDLGWNCIGNPYTSAININTVADASNNFLTLNSSNLDPSFAAIYIWDEYDVNNGSQNYYKTISNAGFTSSHTALGQNQIQVGQGFLVKVKTTPSVVSFTPAMQVNQNSLQLKTSKVAWPAVELNIKTDSLSAYTAIAYNDQMTLGLDPSYDAGLLRSSNKLSLYSHLVNDNGVDFAIQCLPDKQLESQVVPIGLDYLKGGEVKISAQVTGLPSGMNVILEDRVLKTFTVLNSGNATTVTVDPNTKGIGRFYLHTTVLSVSDLKTVTLTGKLNAYVSSNNEIRIVGEVSSKAIATLFDVQGKAILNQNLRESNLNVIPTSNIKTGIYMLSVRDTGKLQSFKLFIKQ